jgi:CubicO group peptidase (beta-lactamase class C family)
MKGLGMEIPAMFRRSVLLVGVVAHFAGAQRIPTDSVGRWVDSIFAQYSARPSPGCGVGVTRAGELAFTKSYGFADLERKTPIAADTRFYLASLSKQFTAMSVVLLSQDGRLSLDDDVRKWVPEVPNFGSTITLRHLLNHTSGLRDYLTLLAVTGWPSDGTFTEGQFLELIGRQRGLNFPPGDQFLYSNTGYVLLSIVVRRASGESLRDFAASRIFTPLGMTHTEFRDDHSMSIPRRALGYVPSATAFQLSEPHADVVGDGGMFSTIEDLSRWDANFASGVVGGKDGVAVLQKPARLNGMDSIPYALGLSIANYRGLRTSSHSGAYGGYRATLLRFPDQGVSVITLCNVATAPLTLAQQVGTVILGSLMKPQEVASIDVTLSGFGAPTSFGRPEGDAAEARRRVDELARVAGSYYSDELDLTVSLNAKDGALVMRRPHSGDIRFTALSGDLYTSRDQMLLLVLRGDGGTVTGFMLTAGRARDVAFTRRGTTGAGVFP